MAKIVNNGKSIEKSSDATWINSKGEISYAEYKKNILEKIKESENNIENIKNIRSTLFYPQFPIKNTNISKEIVRIKKKKEEIENDDLEQNIKLKRRTLYNLFIFLGIETFLIFLFSLFQATKWLGFHLEEWSFKLLVTATISQITYMIQVAVKHLFPNQNQSK
ncbi:MAG: hypothetical protein WAV16_03305 [Candidatus Moraniibacteriota bacterium]